MVRPDNEGPSIPFSKLEIQRRMHPSIAELIGSLYPKLKNHSSIHEYPDVDGMRRRLFWLDHRMLEDAAIPDRMGETSNSKSNEFEAELVAAIVTHLIRQGSYK